MKFCSVNGKQQSELSITDRGLAYGDGLFTTAKVLNGQVVLLDKHMQRLSLGCEALKLKQFCTTTLQKHVIQVAEDYESAVLKIMVTAGSGGRGYSRLGLRENATNFIVMVSEIPEHYQQMSVQGITLGDSEQHIATGSMLGNIKHLNRLEQVLLRAELDERHEDDLVVSDSQGLVIEATSANLFYWMNGQLCTPELSGAGIDGIIRQVIIRQSANVQILKTHVDMLNKAESIFICNSLMGIIPVKSYNNRELATDVVFQLQQQMKGLI